MGKVYDGIAPEIGSWIGRQPMFFVATAPEGWEGHVNCSPKGLDTFRILGPGSVCYLDFTGSGAETVAHIRENGRIVFMFCAFAGPPKIVRLHGVGEIVTPTTREWEDLIGQFAAPSAPRSIIRARITRVSDSCGFGVPRMDMAGERDAMRKWAENKPEFELADYRRKKNATSIDGLPGWDEPA